MKRRGVKQKGGKKAGENNGKGRARAGRWERGEKGGEAAAAGGGDNVDDGHYQNQLDHDKGHIKDHDEDHGDEDHPV
jgi:hypothetical protein